MSDAALAIAGIPSCTPGSDDNRRYSRLKQIVRVVQAGTINRRGPPRVLSRAEYYNRVGMGGFCKVSLMGNFQGGKGNKQNESPGQGRDQPQQPAATDRMCNRRWAHPCAKNSEI